MIDWGRPCAFRLLTGGIGVHTVLNIHQSSNTRGNESHGVCVLLVLANSTGFEGFLLPLCLL